MKTLNRWIVESAEQWDVSPRVARWVFWAPIIGLVVVAAARVDKGFYRFLLEDDGPVEWAQFACFIVASLAAAGVAFQRFRAGFKWQALLFVVFTLGMFVIAGEEIAWGQRLLGLETPAELEAVNLQGEITWHNIVGVLGVVNIVMMLVGLGGAAAYWLNKRLRVERYWDLANYLFVPPFFLTACFWIIFLYRLFRLVIWRDSGFTITKFGEWPELCLAFGLGAFAWLNYRRLAAKPLAPVAVSESVVVSQPGQFS